MPGMNQLGGPPPTPTPPMPPPGQDSRPEDDDNWLMKLLKKVFGFDREDDELDPYTIRPGIGMDMGRVLNNLEDPTYRQPMPTPRPY
jgi:hypothetical protein